MADLNSTVVNGNLRVTGGLIIDGLPDNVFNYVKIGGEYYEISFGNGNPESGILIFNKVDADEV